MAMQTGKTSKLKDIGPCKGYRMLCCESGSHTEDNVHFLTYLAEKYSSSGSHLRMEIEKCST